MVVLGIESFEGSEQVFASKWNIPVSSVSLQGEGREGGLNSSDMEDVLCYFRPTEATTSGPTIIGFGINPQSTLSSGDAMWIGVGQGSRVQCSVQISKKSSGGFQVRAYRGSGADGAGTALGAVTDISISASTWTYLEFRYTVDNTAGEISYRINGGADAVLVSSVDTQRLGNNGINAVHMFQRAGYLLDDLYFLDESTAGGGGGQQTFLGPQVARTVNLSTAAVSGMTVNGGSAEAVVADQNPNTYVQGTTSGDKVTFTTDDVSSLGTAFAAVQIDAIAKTADQGNRNVRTFIEDAGGTAINAVNKTLTSTDDVGFSRVFTEDSGGNALDSSDISSLEIGVEIS